MSEEEKSEEEDDELEDGEGVGGQVPRTLGLTGSLAFGNGEGAGVWRAPRDAGMGNRFGNMRGGFWGEDDEP